MSDAHLHSFMEGDIQAIWTLIHKQVEVYGEILAAREPDLLVVRQADMCYVYGLHTTPIGKVDIFLAVTTDLTAALAAADAPDLFAAITALPAEVEQSVVEAAQAHLQDLRNRLRDTSGSLTQDPKKSGYTSPVPYQPLYTLKNIWLVYIFLGGVFSATLMLAVNWWSMGFKRKAVSTVVSVAAVWTILYLLVFFVMARIDTTLLTNPVAGTLIGLVTSIGVLLWQVSRQKPFYEQRVSQSGKPSSRTCSENVLTIVVILAGIGIGVLWPTVTAAVIGVMNVAYTSVAPRSVYSNDRITVSYPSHWHSYDFPKDVCNPPVECLLGVSEPVGGGALTIVQVEDVFGSGTTLQSLSNEVQTNTKAKISDIEYVHVTDVTIDGRAAVRQDYAFTVQSPSPQPVRDIVLLVQDGSAIVRLEIGYPPALASIAENVVASLHFVKPVSSGS